MENGIYHIEFKPAGSDTVGNGLVVLQNGSVNGGDISYIYRGMEITKGENIISKIQVSRYDASQQSIFGSLENFDLELSGTLSKDGREFSLSGTIVGQPQFRIHIAGKKLRDLAPLVTWGT
jgi:hypothetical protein